MSALERLRTIGDPKERLREAGELLAEVQSTAAEIGEIRRGAIDELRAQGMTLAQIATIVGVSVARLSQLSAPRKKPERALLSSGNHVTVGVPVEEASYPGGRSRLVLHKEDTEFVSQIQNLASSLGLTSDVEHVEPDQFIDLNRDGMVLTCGPRQSPWLEQILAADSEYGFLKDEQGWYLFDRRSGEKYRSPADRGESRDYGYLGALPRPDGNGTWLYIAGIHAAGSRGGARYLEQHISEIHRQANNSLWSCLISCDYEPNTRELLNVELLSPLRRRGRVKTK
ncbi:MAG: sigma-70 family RNA polymerase sigma factor [Corynebacteriales bacterium]|nr:sigma-70 family RNA polymerase sigma factor [Mycobacteriales bacterium]